MKGRNILLSLVLAFTLVCCTSKEEQITEQYINANLEELFAGTDCSVKVSNWNKHPIDTITKGEIYRYYIRQLHNEAEYNKELRDICTRLLDSYQGIINSSRRLGLSYTWILDDKREAEHNYSKHNRIYHNALRLEEELESKTDGDELFIFAYPFQTKVTFGDEDSKSKEPIEISCFSYMTIAQDEVVAILFRDEYERDLSRIPLSLVLDEQDEETDEIPL